MRCVCMQGQNTCLAGVNSFEDPLLSSSRCFFLLCDVCVRAESNKSLEEMEEEEYLIQRKVEIVNQRNVIVDSMDEDRLR